jgi:hypothetical protein
VVQPIKNDERGQITVRQHAIVAVRDDTDIHEAKIARVLCRTSIEVAVL